MFDEYFNPPSSVISPVPVAAAARAVDIADSPVSMSIDQDAPSTSIPSTQEKEHSLIISQGVEESPKIPHFYDDLLYESLFEDSTYLALSSNVDPSRSVSMRKQLETDAIWCYFDTFLTSVEPKNFKQAMTKPLWIDAITWMAFGGNTRDLGSFGEETDEITDLHQILEEVLLTERGAGVAGIKRCRCDPSSDNVRDLVTASGRSRLNEDLESST
nr:hypothetical protein [Tanacetum cinerariifolium]